jgi:hypothetical protein
MVRDQPISFRVKLGLMFNNIFLFFLLCSFNIYQLQSLYIESMVIRLLWAGFSALWLLGAHSTFSALEGICPGAYPSKNLHIFDFIISGCIFVNLVWAVMFKIVAKFKWLKKNALNMDSERSKKTYLSSRNHTLMACFTKTLFRSST